MPTLPLLFPLLALLTRSLHATTCYRPDGTANKDPAVEPCNQSGGKTMSMCCSLNRTSYPDQCLSNGLCGGGGNLFRDSCTDPTWKSPLCLNLCTTGTGQSGTAIGVSERKDISISSYLNSILLREERKQEKVLLTAVSYKIVGQADLRDQLSDYSKLYTKRRASNRL